MTYTAIDLFSGAGGLSLGLQRSGFDLRLAADSWEVAVATHRLNFDSPVACLDLGMTSSAELLQLAGVEAGALDLLGGGPPCQGFSIQRIGKDADARNDLVLKFAKHITNMQPRMFLMENVLGLLGRRGRAICDAFLADVRAAGYLTQVFRVNAADFGVPQNRRRVLVLGHRLDAALPDLEDFKAAKRATVRMALESLPLPAPVGAAGSADPLHIESRLSELNRRRIALIPPGGGFEDLPLDLRVPAHRLGAAVIGHRGVYGRLHPDEAAGTITARFDSFTRGRFGHPWATRNLTLREGARLQTFPDDFRFVGNREEIAAQIGNAVPPLLARRVGVALRDTLASEQTTLDCKLP